MKKTFAKILNEEMTKRGWSADRTAKEILRNGGDVATSTVTVWANAGSIPNAKHGKAICKTIAITPEQFLDAAAFQGKAA